jgi:enterochelin esterase family protein
MRRRGVSVVIAALLSAPVGALAQQPARRPTPNDTLVSPEVLSDRRVAFRIYAPKASAVTLRGDWMTPAEPTRASVPPPVELAKDDSGVWSATVGPLEPDLYNYMFTVDGVRTLDPKNPLIKQGVTSVDNMFFVAGDAAAFHANQPVPHGEIRQAWYRSTTLDAQRRLHIYTPPGYDGGSTRYPVLYLLHGGGDEDSGWSTIGRAGFILDNLIAGKKAAPMLIVMPNGSLPRPASLPAPVPGAPPNPAATATMQELFTNELMREVVPFVERSYRVLKEPRSRAIAGLSMGGGQTLRVVTTHPEQFAYVAIWSAGLAPQSSSEFETRAASFLGSAAKLNKSFALLSISVGDKDFALEGSRHLSAVLNKHGVRHDLHVSGGGHTWINWRRYLNDLAPRLFRAAGETN